MTKEEIMLLSEQLADKINFATKEILTAQEAASYMGISMSYLYKLTRGRKIPHYKPMGKICYFKRSEVEQWMFSNRISTEQEINNKALSYCRRK